MSRLEFANPVATWQADHLSGVEEAVRRVETTQRQGLYVAGIIRYEAGPAFDPALKAHSLPSLPLVWFAAFNQPAAAAPAASESKIAEPQLRTAHSDYKRNVRTALEHIRQGNIYQVNYTVRADLQIEGDPYSIWRNLCDAVPVPHAAYIDTGDSQILSLSPELFLRKRGSLIETQPMKGTAPRNPSWIEDEQARLALERSAKDRAENIMIVDLMRNDLSRICKAGSVHVAELCRAYRFPTVHQMTSTVRGELAAGVSLFDIFKAAFPPGSVTGAPKVRATEIIRELEPESRGIYCGSICLFYPSGDFICNVAIRTLESSLHPSSLILHPFTLGLGSGIVIDSDPELEWQETLVKSRFSQAKPQTFGLFETFRYTPGAGQVSPPFTGGQGGVNPAGTEKGRRAGLSIADSSSDDSSEMRNPAGTFRNLHSHLMRLKRSCDYFSRPFPLRKILRTLRDAKPSLGDSPHRVRLELSREAEITLRLVDENLSWPADGVTLLLSEIRLDPADPRLYHKTTDREEKYTALKHAENLGAHEVLFLNTRGELCEGAISNIFLNINGEWLTPALSCGLLPGVWRDNQLKSGRAREAFLTLDDLRRAGQILVGNSVRGEAKVQQVIYPNIP
ncbi:aminodeoxychorismate synthase component I [bacterium]|nr:aminodeoxychorismate synthase component I [bacterium]